VAFSSSIGALVRIGSLHADSSLTRTLFVWQSLSSCCARHCARVRERPTSARVTTRSVCETVEAHPNVAA
jgi:hypothetical protein